MSALSYRKITQQEDEALSFVKALYESAFPVQERREWTDFTSRIDIGSEMQLELVREQHRPIAFVIWWPIGSWMFIEHLAVSALERGKNYGSQIVSHYLDQAQGKMFLEVEPPLTEEAHRRIQFYERLGMALLDCPYEQPSYREKGVVYPMRLMGSKKDLQEVPEFNQLVLLMKSTVYQ